MRAVNRWCLAGGLALAALWTAGTAFAQNAGDKNLWPQTPELSSRPFDPDPPATGLGLLQNGPWVTFPDDSDAKPASGHLSCNLCDHAHGFFAGAEFLLLRTHFSEAYAYARVFQTLATPSTRDVQAVRLPFDYDPSLRVFVGYRLGEDAGDLRFTYWHYRTDAKTGEVVGNQAGVGQFIVDPLGNTVQTGDFIRAQASVENNVYDLDYDAPMLPRNPHWALTGSVGVRVADFHQHYEDPLLDPTGALLSTGHFAAHFVGAGPRLGVEARRSFGQNGRLSLYAKGSGALLVGDYDFNTGTTVPGFTGNQSAHLTRLVPVAEMEVGASWQPWKRLTLSAGWLFQAWFDLGASGGQFGGIYMPTDDANIMSFDGLVVRAELAF
jgi:hypothetical protein